MKEITLISKVIFYVLLGTTAVSASYNLNDTELAAYLSPGVLTMQKGQTTGDTRNIDPQFFDLIQELENLRLISGGVTFFL